VRGRPCDSLGSIDSRRTTINRLFDQLKQGDEIVVRTKLFAIARWAQIPLSTPVPLTPQPLSPAGARGAMQTEYCGTCSKLDWPPTAKKQFTALTAPSRRNEPSPRAKLGPLPEGEVTNSITQSERLSRYFASPLR
jgi:hypothetical protein